MQSKSFFQSLNQRQCQALQALEKYRGSNLQNANPFEPRFADTPAGKSAREFLDSKFPQEAAEFRSMVEGFAPSLQAVMYDQGWVENTAEIHAEKMSSDPIYRQQREANQKAEEERILREWESKANELAHARGYDPDSKMGIANYDKRFSQYFNHLTQDEALEERLRNEAK